MTSSKEGMAQFVQDIMESRFALPYEEGRSKVIPLAEAIQQNVEEGMSIHLLGLHYRSHAAIYELLRQFWNGQPDFTIVAPIRPWDPTRFIIESLRKDMSPSRIGAFSPLH